MADNLEQSDNLQSGNLVILPDGSKHMFPAGTSVDQMRKQLNLGPQVTSNNQQTSQQAGGLLYGNTPNQIDPRAIVDKLRPFIAGGAGTLASAGTALIPGVGETGLAELGADTQGYAIVDSLMKYLGTNPPKSYSEALTDSEKDAAVNAVAGKLMGTVFKGVKSFFSGASEIPDFYKYAPTTSQALEKYGMNKLATASRFIEDYGVPSAKAAALDKSGGEGFTQALAHANSLNGRMAGTNSDPQKLYDSIKFSLQNGLDEAPDYLGYKSGMGAQSQLHTLSQDALDMLEYGDGNKYKVLDNVIGDKDKLAKVLKVGQITGSAAMNVKQDLAAYKFMDMVNKATTKDVSGSVRINPTLLNEQWLDPEMQSSFKQLYGSDGIKDISEFFNNISLTQKTPGANNRYLRYGATAGKFYLGLDTIRHVISTGSLSSALPTAAIALTANTVGRLLTKPSTARIVVDMSKGALTDNPVWTAKVLGNALRNTTVGLVSGDGKETQGSFKENPQTGLLEFAPDR